ncbi:protein of unknown function [Pararobbsia alpina]
MTIHGPARGSAMGVTIKIHFASMNAKGSRVCVRKSHSLGGVGMTSRESACTRFAG